MIKIKCKEKEDYKTIKKELEKNNIPCYMRKKKVSVKEEQTDQAQQTPAEETTSTEQEKKNKIVKKSLVVDDEGFLAPVNRIIHELQKKELIASAKVSTKGDNISLIEADLSCISDEALPPDYDLE